MHVRWLGWAGVELEHAGETVVVDALADPGAVFAPFGERAADAPLPELVAPRPRAAAAALVTHLHRDHADAGAIAEALSPGACLYEPPRGTGALAENLALAQAEHELASTGIARVSVEPWDTVSAGPFEMTAIPAADGLGDPQLSWLVRAGGISVLHLGDTVFHGWWWRIAQRLGPFDLVLAPVNGAVVDFPHRQPPSGLPVVMTPEQAAIAAEILGARLAAPMHASGYDFPHAYEPVADAARSFADHAARRGVRVTLPALGEPFALRPATAAPEGRPTAA